MGRWWCQIQFKDNTRLGLSLRPDKKTTREKLLGQLDIIKMTYYIHLKNENELKSDRSARTRRRQIKVISGGLSWVPQCLKVGEPIGKLSLVRAA